MKVLLYTLNIFSCDYLETGLRQTLISQQKEKFEVDRDTDIKNNPITSLNTDTLTLQGNYIFRGKNLSMERSAYPLAWHRQSINFVW